jgi:hypothetical protein
MQLIFWTIEDFCAIFSRPFWTKLQLPVGNRYSTGAVGFFGGFGARGCGKMRKIRISTNIKVEKISGLNV